MPLRSKFGQKKDFDIINNLGYAYRCIVDIDNANKYIEMADEILPGSYPVLVNKIHIAFALRNFNEAKRLLEICFKNFIVHHHSNAVDARTLLNVFFIKTHSSAGGSTTNNSSPKSNESKSLTSKLFKFPRTS